VLLFLFSCFAVQFSQGVSQDSQTVANYGSIVQHERIITYFQCSFAYEEPESYSKGDLWPTWEPCGYPNEKGIWHWVVVRRSKETYGGNMRLIDDPADPSRLCLETVLDYPGERPLPDDQDSKLYECQGRKPENYPEPYRRLKEAYYQAKYWFPSDFKVEGWRLIWQVCGEEGVYGNPEHTYAPQISLIFSKTKLRLCIARYYYPDGERRIFPLISNVDLPKERWVSIQVYVKQGSAYRSLDGIVIAWIDGVKVFERNDIPTATYSGTPYVIWGIGNYGGPDEAQGQFHYIKDVMVTSGYTGS